MVCVLMEYSSAIKTGNLAICDNMDGPWGCYAKWSKSERWTSYDLNDVWNLEKQKGQVLRTDGWLQEVGG